MKILDGFGKQCPMPLVMAKKELDAGVTELAIQVDNETAVKNLTRLGKKKNMATSVDKIEGGWLITFGEGDGTEAEAPAAILEAGNACSTTGGCGYSVFVGKDFVGDGDLELGRNLMKMALYTLSEAGDSPTSLLFMNADEAASVMSYTQQLSVANAYATPLLLGVNVLRLSIQGMGYSRLSLISGLLEMLARTAVSLWAVPAFGFDAACLASPLAWLLADCFLVPGFYGCLNARRRQAARVRKELPEE